LSAAAAAHRSAAADRDADQAALPLGEDAEAAARAAPVEDDAPDRLGLPNADEVLAIQQETGCTVEQAVREHRRRSGAGGRKRGSGNRRNKEFRDFVLSRGGHPGEFLQRVYDRPVEQLAAELVCDKKEALDRQIRCAAELLPFIEGKMPTKVDLTVKGDMQLVAGAGTGLFDGIEDADWTEAPQLGFAEENQALGDSEPGQSD
jgi:hypothetical protein